MKFDYLLYLPNNYGKDDKAGHDSWTATYKNPDVWEWLLKQKRASGK